MSKNVEILSNDDVISVIYQDENTFVSGNTLKPKQLLEEYRIYLDESNISQNGKTILEQGIQCEVLRHNSKQKGWRKGKIKFVVQFEPEEAENESNPNSLDDIRQQIDHTN